MVLTEDTVASRLRKVDGTQDAIQTMSMWMLHYRDAASIQIIVSTWLNVFRTSNDDQRVNLFYVMNDVVMRAKRKTHNDELISAFRDQVIAAVSIGRSSDVVRRSMSKCILLFEEKKVFTQDIITELKKALEDIPDGEDFDFDQAKLHQDIEAYRKGDAVMEKAHGILKRSEFAFAQEIKARMKGFSSSCPRLFSDRKEGVKLVNEVAAAVKKLDDFANTVKSHRQRCLNLIDMVENAKRAFATQLRDVTIVEDAYQKFFSGIRESMIKEGVYPGASPPHDAPSPTANDDIYAGGVEKVLQSIHAPGSRDNLETTDMDMDDDEVGVSSTVAAANARLAAQAITVPPPFTPNNGALNLANIPMPPLNVSTGMPGQMWPPPMTAPSPSKVGSIPTPSTPVTHANLPPPGAPPPIFSPNVPPPFPPFNVNIPPPQPGQGFTSPPPPLYSPSMPNWSGQYFPSTPTNPNFSQPPPQDGNFDNANNSGDFRRNSYGGGGPRGGRGGGFRGDFRGRGGFQGRRNTSDGRFDDRGGRGGYRGGGGGGGYH